MKQKKALEIMVENGGNASRAMIDAGYSINTAKNPSKLTSSVGFIKLCEEKGLTDDLLLNALVEDIKKKKGNRKAEIELGFKIKGRLVQKTDITSNEKQISLSTIAPEDCLKIKQAIRGICNHDNQC